MEFDCRDWLGAILRMYCGVRLRSNSGVVPLPDRIIFYVAAFCQRYAPETLTPQKLGDLGRQICTLVTDFPKQITDWFSVRDDGLAV